MKFINTRWHSLMDYGIAAVLLLPYTVNYYQMRDDTLVLAAVGFLILLYTSLTDYEYGLIKFISVKLNLAFDILCAIFLILIPFIFPLNHYHFYWPVLLGISEIIIVAGSSSRAYVVTKNDLNIISRP